jgi:hypothetical protein
MSAQSKTELQHNGMIRTLVNLTTVVRNHSFFFRPGGIPQPHSTIAGGHYHRNELCLQRLFQTV